MRFYPLDRAIPRPVSHDPQLKKMLLTGEIISCISNLSHIKLVPGSTVSVHSHEAAAEVFLCIRGSAVFGFGETEVTLTGGGCLVADPGESHSIKRVLEETELFYFFVSSEKDTS